MPLHSPLLSIVFCIDSWPSHPNTLSYQILHACEERDEAYETCCEVLSQLNEIIPKSMDIQQVVGMMKQTGEMLIRITENELLEMKEMNSDLRYTLKFYTLLVRGRSIQTRYLHFLQLLFCVFILCFSLLTFRRCA